MTQNVPANTAEQLIMLRNLAGRSLKQVFECGHCHHLSTHLLIPDYPMTIKCGRCGRQVASRPAIPKQLA